jgi:hypothetical protein
VTALGDSDSCTVQDPPDRSVNNLQLFVQGAKERSPNERENFKFMAAAKTLYGTCAFLERKTASNQVAMQIRNSP